MIISKERDDRAMEQPVERESMNLTWSLWRWSSWPSSRLPLMQLVKVVAKSSQFVWLRKVEIGAHILSGAIFEPTALNGVPGLEERGALPNNPSPKT